ncbi:MgtC/SapB family protein [Ralstonia solanacearum]|uniref:MgtC/SapB family protein n=1 Tax=Ralstonia solanacearum TaxID=305 RepID=UPI001E364F69|nr:MgtC/SapB family protein [Ralstonia solanacearum]
MTDGHRVAAPRVVAGGRFQICGRSRRLRQIKSGTVPACILETGTIVTAAIRMSSLLSFSVALGVALAIGLERERSQAATTSELPAGIRTFAIAGLAGAIAASLPVPLAVPAVLLGVAALATVGYHHSAQLDPGITTELALVATALLGAYAVSAPEMAAALGTVLLVLLYAKTALHRFARVTLTQRELADLLTLAVAALLVWPAIPDRNLGPLQAWNPHTLWLLVLLIMVTGNVGHFAARWLGERLGLPLAGLFSGFASSVATVAAMATRVRAHRCARRPAVAGALLSNVATLIQMALIIAAIDAGLLRTLALPLIAGAATTAACAAVSILRKETSVPVSGHEATASSIDWRIAVGFGIWTAALLLAVAAARAWFGPAALIAVTLAGALVDVHATTASIAAQVAGGALIRSSAGMLVMLALTANTASKIVAAWGGGSGFARPTAAGLLLALAAGWAAFLITA